MAVDEDEEKKTSEWAGPRLGGRKSSARKSRRRKMAKAAKAKKAKRRKKS
jgi:hypothetical protein